MYSNIFDTADRERTGEREREREREREGERDAAPGMHSNIFDPHLKCLIRSAQQLAPPDVSSYRNTHLQTHIHA